MRKESVVAAALLVAALAPAPAFAWGAVAHRYIMRRAIELLPPEIKPFFEHNRDELVLRVNDPDLWRVVGFEDEPPNHQIDFGVDDYGPYPFVALPREYDAAVEKFGVAVVRRHGLLPWRTMEEFGNLRRIFEGFSRNQLYVDGNTVLFASALAHYIQDAHQPLHVHNNYDGQLTGQNGLHSRFESELFERFESRLTINPPPFEPGRQRPRVHLRRRARQLPAGAEDPGGRPRRHRRQGHVRRRILRGVLHEHPAGARAAAGGRDHRDGERDRRRVDAGRQAGVEELDPPRGSEGQEALVDWTTKPFTWCRSDPDASSSTPSQPTRRIRCAPREAAGFWSRTIRAPSRRMAPDWRARRTSPAGRRAPDGWRACATGWSAGSPSRSPSSARSGRCARSHRPRSSIHPICPRRRRPPSGGGCSRARAVTTAGGC